MEFGTDVRQRRIAVLGVGIMGSATALYLARRGAAVTFLDAAERPFADGDIYLCHRDSVVSPDAMHDYFRRVTGLVRGHPDAKR